jgi:2-methylcitrate dehydratase PrpD
VVTGVAPLIEALADWSASLPATAIPSAQVHAARLRILDTLGLVAAARGTPACEAVLRWRAGMGGAGEATVLVGPPLAAPALAAFVHGTLAHSRDFDDTFLDSVIHPGSTIVSTVLAVGERAGADFDAMVAGIVVGYEVAARLGRYAGRRFHARGFHATSVIGPIAAAAAAGRVSGLSADATADAMGLSTSMGSGLLAFLGDGGWSKWLHTGWAAHGGITAAELGACGFRGPRQGLDHVYGLYGAFLGAPPSDAAPFLDGLGTVWHGAAALPKLYPCAHVIQPYIDAVIDLRTEHGLSPGRIAGIVCVMAPWAMPVVAEPRAPKLTPRNDLEAIASLPYMVATAACTGAVGLDDLGPAALVRPDVLAMAGRIACVADAALGLAFDGRITLTLTDGSVLERPVAAAPPADDRVLRKVRANLGGEGRAIDALLACVLNAASPDVRTVMAHAAEAFRSS